MKRRFTLVEEIVHYQHPKKSSLSRANAFDCAGFSIAMKKKQHGGQGILNDGDNSQSLETALVIRGAEYNWIFLCRAQEILQVDKNPRRNNAVGRQPLRAQTFRRS